LVQADDGGLKNSRSAHFSCQEIVITQNGEARGVLVDPRSYQEMMDALAILKLISQSERSIELDDVKTHEEVVGELRQRLSTA
jgi:hypothetical protein